MQCSSFTNTNTRNVVLSQCLPEMSFKLPLLESNLSAVSISNSWAFQIATSSDSDWDTFQSPVAIAAWSSHLFPSAADNQDWAFKESGLARGQQSFRLLASRRRASRLQPLKSSSFYTHSDPLTLCQKATKTSNEFRFYSFSCPFISNSCSST